MKLSKFSSSWVGNGVVGNLLEKYWFLDSFSADLVRDIGLGVG